MIVIDTHVLLWWVSGENEKLSPAALQAIESEASADQEDRLRSSSPSGEIIVSTFSSWELAMLISKGRVALSMDLSAWLSIVSGMDVVRFIPVDNEIAVRSTELPGDFHKDPADRIIVATARMFAAPLVTADEKIRDYPHVRTIW